MVEIDEHERTATRFDGGWRAYQDARAAARRHAEEAYAGFVDTRDHLRGQAQQTREWSAKGVRKAKRSNEPDKFIRHHDKSTSEKLAGKAARAEKALERLDVVEKPWEGWDLRLEFATAGRSGDDVVAGPRSRRRPRRLHARPDRRSTSASASGSRSSGPTARARRTLLGAVLGTVDARPRAPAALGPSVRRRHARPGPAAASPPANRCSTRSWPRPGVAADEARSQLAKLGLGAEHIATPAPTPCRPASAPAPSWPPSPSSA